MHSTVYLETKVKMADLTIQLLGRFQVTVGCKPATLKSEKVCALLAFLATESDMLHSRALLAEMLWPDRPWGGARANLRHTLAELRRAIGDTERARPFLLVSRDTIRLDPASNIWVDVREMIRLTRSQASIPDLEQVANIYQGEFLPDLMLGDSTAFEEWSIIQREQLEQLARSAFCTLAQHYEMLARLEPALALYRRLVAMEPLDEHANRQVMRLLAQTGRRAAAMAQYESCRGLLASSLGVEPDAETIALRDRLLESPALLAPDRSSHNLPSPVSPLVGRRYELVAATECLRDSTCRLLSLIGPGGSGKSRLALEVAQQTAALFEHGVFLVRLAKLDQVDDMVPAIAGAMGLAIQQTERIDQQLRALLRPLQVLLILDNFEHLQRGADLVSRILKAAPRVKVMATSRTRLNLSCEKILKVDGLQLPPLPDQDGLLDINDGADLGPDQAKVLEASAVQLFVQSARRIDPEFQPRDHLADIVHICHLVDGLPLGILLAAGWVHLLTPAEIAVRISQGLDFLASKLYDLPERQRSMRAVLDHTWRLLTEREQVLLMQMSVFSKTIPAEGAIQVTGASLHELRSLVDKSVLQPSTENRFEMHELLGRHVAEKLAESPTLHQKAKDAHCRYFSDLLQGLEVDLESNRQPKALALIEKDLDNIRAAWHWAAHNGLISCLSRAMEALDTYFWRRGRYREGEASFRLAALHLASVRVNNDDDVANLLKVRITALLWQSDFCRALGGNDQATLIHKQCQKLLAQPGLMGVDTRREKALLYRLMSYSALVSDHKRATCLCELSLALYRELGDRWREAALLSSLGKAVCFTGQLERAQELCSESHFHQEAIGDQTGAARSLANLAEIALMRGRLLESEELGRASCQQGRALGDPTVHSYGLLILGTTLEGVGAYEEAIETLDEALARFDRLGQRSYASSAHLLLGRANMHLGQYDDARLHARAALSLASETHLRFRVGSALGLLGCVALAEGKPQRALQQMKEGIVICRQAGHLYELTLGMAFASFLPQNGLQFLGEALRLTVDLKLWQPLVVALRAAAALSGQTGRSDIYQEIEQAIGDLAFVARSRWFELVAGDYQPGRTVARPLLTSARPAPGDDPARLLAIARKLIEESDSKGGDATAGERLY